MTQQAIIILAMLLLICATALTLFLDSRQRRIDRRVATALSSAETANIPSIRRSRTASGQNFLYRIANYKPGLTYSVDPRYVLCAAAITAGAALYGAKWLQVSLPLALLAAAIGMIVVIRFLFGWQRRRMANTLFRQLPDTIAIVTSAVRSGLPVSEAFRVIARELQQPTSGQFALVCNDIDLGVPVEEALASVFRRTEVAEYGFFAVTLSVQLKAGGSLAETLQTLADTVRQRVTLAGRAKALAGEVIFSSRALTLAPFIVGGILHQINPQLLDLLFTDPTGRMMLAYAGASVLTGNIVMQWMIRRGTAT